MSDRFFCLFVNLSRAWLKYVKITIKQKKKSYVGFLTSDQSKDNKPLDGNTAVIKLDMRESFSRAPMETMREAHELTAVEKQECSRRCSVIIKDRGSLT